MCARPSKSGKPNSILRSKRPGRNYNKQTTTTIEKTVEISGILWCSLTNAGSNVSGRLVAINTLILPRASNPSNCVINSTPTQAQKKLNFKCDFEQKQQTYPIACAELHFRQCLRQQNEYRQWHRFHRRK